MFYYHHPFEIEETGTLNLNPPGSQKCISNSFFTNSTETQIEGMARCLI